LGPDSLLHVALKLGGAVEGGVGGGNAAKDRGGRLSENWSRTKHQQEQPESGGTDGGWMSGAESKANTGRVAATRAAVKVAKGGDAWAPAALRQGAAPGVTAGRIGSGMRAGKPQQQQKQPKRTWAWDPKPGEQLVTSFPFLPTNAA
jgi:hypothetical protein